MVGAAGSVGGIDYQVRFEPSPASVTEPELLHPPQEPR
jgi:hypothetical protein